MKKLFFACVIIISLCLCLSSCDKEQRWKKYSFGENVSALFHRGVLYDISDDKKTAEVYGYIRVPKKLRIEKRFRGRPVTKISEYAFKGCDKIESVKITKNISKITSGTFSSCQNLEKVIINSDLEYIDVFAFGDCESLTDVKIKGSIQKIYLEAFEDSRNIKNVYINDLEDWCNIDFVPHYDRYSPDSLYINSLTRGTKLYVKGDRIIDLTIPDGITEIKDFAFMGFIIEKLILPDSVTSIGTEAFSYCTAINEISFGSNLKTIKASAFVNCEDLERINIKDISAWCETELENNVFIVRDEYGNEKYEKERRLYLNGEQITNLVIPEGITKIGDYTFYNIKGIETLTTPESLSTIGKYAFGLSDISTITLAGNLQSIGEYAFSCCDNLTSVTITSSTDEEHEGMVIEEYAFISCTALTTVRFADCIKQIQSGAFRLCENLTKAYLENPNRFSSPATRYFDLSDPYEAAEYLRNGSKLY